MQRSKKNQSGVYVVFGPTTRKAIFFWSQATKKMQGWGMQGMQTCCILQPSGFRVKDMRHDFGHGDRVRHVLGKVAMSPVTCHIGLRPIGFKKS